MSYAGGTPSSNRGIYEEIVRLQQAGELAALATPVRIKGSVPCVSESRLLIREDGSTMGTIGGGLLEAEVLEEAPTVMTLRKPRLLDFDLKGDTAATAGMICGGSCTILIELILPGRAVDVYAAAAKSEAEGRHITLITALPDRGRFCKLAVFKDGTFVGSAGEPGLDAMLRHMGLDYGAEEDPSLVYEPFRICIQPVRSRPSVFIFGAGHVAVPVAHLAELVGFRTVVIDDRSEFANADRFPGADQVVVAHVDEAFDKLAINAGSYIVVVTRGHAMDEEVVEHALRTQARYIGMIGSKRKVAAICHRLRDQGFSKDDIARLHAPIGLDIGAETVEEIALSIAAELVAVRRVGK